LLNSILSLTPASTAHSCCHELTTDILHAPEAPTSQLTTQNRQSQPS
jgi:hypothetical protein